MTEYPSDWPAELIEELERQREVPAGWEEADECVRTLMHAIVERVEARFPEIRTRMSRFRTMGQLYGYTATFDFDLEDETWEDIGVFFYCDEIEKIRQGYPDLAIQGRPDQVAAIFAIEEGSGEEIAVLQPQVLSDNEGSQEFREAVLNYIDTARQFTDENMGLLLEKLRFAQLLSKNEGGG